MVFKRRGDPWQPFPTGPPIRVEGGLTTSRPRGPIADSWWSRRFVQTVESYGLGGRLERGRRYARQGQILSLDTSPGLLAAVVQGSRPTPYLVNVVWPGPTPEQWDVVDAAMRARVGLAAHLLAGEVPPELEDVFAAAGTPLFPARWTDLVTRCNCPDHVNPCKHIAAVLYLFADRLDSEPWLLLEWRGRSRDDVLTALGLQGVGSVVGGSLPPWWPLRPGEPLPAGIAAVPYQVDPPEPPDVVLRRLDRLEVVAWKAPVEEALRDVYAAIVAAPATNRE
jgi:SWIM zinc finger